MTEETKKLVDQMLEIRRYINLDSNLNGGMTDAMQTDVFNGVVEIIASSQPIEYKLSVPATWECRGCSKSNSSELGSCPNCGVYK